jgi:hypothetical protein
MVRVGRNLEVVGEYEPPEGLPRRRPEILLAPPPSGWVAANPTEALPPGLERAFYNVRRLPRLPHRTISPIGSGIEAHDVEDMDRVSAMLVRISEQVPALADVAAKIPIRVAAPGEPVRTVCRFWVDDDTAAFYDYQRPSIGILSGALIDDVALTHELIHAAWASLITRDDSFGLHRMIREMARGPRSQEFESIGELVAYFGAFYLAGHGAHFENELPELHAWLVQRLGNGRIRTSLSDEDGGRIVRGVIALFRGETSLP